MDQALEYYKKAYQSDPSYLEGKYSYGATAIYLEGDSATATGKQADYLRYMKDYLNAYPADVDAAEAYAYISNLTGDTEEAIRVTENIIRRNPGMSRLYNPMSYYYILNGDAQKAVGALREYERLEGPTTETLIRKVSYLISVGDTVGALTEADSYVASSSDKAQAMLDKAMLYNALEMKDSALHTLENALVQFPDNGEIKFDIGMIYAERGDSVTFHRLISEAFDSRSMEYDDRMQLLSLYNRSLKLKSDFSASDELYAKAARIYGEDPTFLETNASYEMIKGNYPAAFAMLQKALGLEKENVHLMARVLSISPLAEKIPDGLKAFEEFPDPDARKQYGILLPYITVNQMAEKYDKALAWTDTLISVEIPGLSLADTVTEEMVDSLALIKDYEDIFNASVAYEVGGDIYAKLGRNRDAIRSYDNSVVLSFSTNASALNNYAYFLIETEKVAPGTDEFEKAKEMSRKSLEQSGYEPEANYLDTYAWILFREQEYKDALTYIETAMEIENSPGAELLSHYGDILFMNGRHEEAIEQWEKALKEEPKDKLLKKKVEHKTFFYE